ncbi:MAG TPA: hypothetical protein VN039_01095, partial [Nitrospira sp.]|nr:hypothetical protein [Nitrospira sp.]
YVVAGEPCALLIEDAASYDRALQQVRTFYNHLRPHQHLYGRTPAEVWADVDVFTPAFKSRRCCGVGNGTGTRQCTVRGNEPDSPAPKECRPRCEPSLRGVTVLTKRKVGGISEQMFIEVVVCCCSALENLVIGSVPPAHSSKTLSICSAGPSRTRGRDIGIQELHGVLFEFRCEPSSLPHVAPPRELHRAPF